MPNFFITVFLYVVSFSIVYLIRKSIEYFIGKSGKKKK